MNGCHALDDGHANPIPVQFRVELSVALHVSVE
jgi:hypothetical protein